MPIWEYMELEIKNWPKGSEEMTVGDDGRTTVGRKNLVSAMNLLGGKGWEAYDSEAYQSNGLTRVFLKRQKG